MKKIKSLLFVIRQNNPSGIALGWAFTLLWFFSPMVLAEVNSQSSKSDYPQKPIRLVVPSSPGGGIVALARAMVPRMTEHWGKSIIIDNRAGAGGLIGSEIVARSTPDGYTVLMVAGGYTLNPSLYKKLPYDTLRDFERVSLVACSPLVLVSHASTGARSQKELIAMTKKNPNTLTYASSGIGSVSYLAAEILKHMTGMPVIHVPYKGAGLSNAAIIAGQVQFMFAAPHTMIQHVKTGRVFALGVSSIHRLPLIPDVPTVAENGFPSFDVNTCYGVLLPAKTPKVIVDKLSAEVVRTLHLPEVKANLEGQSFDIIASSAEEFDRFTRQELIRWPKILKEAGIQPE